MYRYPKLKPSPPPRFEPKIEDKRLDRLYDYTKFHIGIYLSAAAGLTGLLASIANKTAGEFLFDLVGSPPLLGLALLLMVLAGACGGVVATSITESKKFDDLWNGPQGPSWWRDGPPGHKWVAAEHLLFWCSLVLAIAAMLWRRKTLEWLLILPPQ